MRKTDAKQRRGDGLCPAPQKIKKANAEKRKVLPDGHQQNAETLKTETLKVLPDGHQPPHPGPLPQGRKINPTDAKFVPPHPGPLPQGRRGRESTGGEWQEFHNTLTELAAVIHSLRERVESAPAGAHLGRASAMARAGLKFVAVVLLAAGVGVGLGDGNLYDDVGPGVAQQPSWPVHGADVRQTGEPPDGIAPGAGGGADDGGQDTPHPASGHLLPSAEKDRPECETWAKVCFFRLPDGRCEATEQACRLCGACESNAAIDDIRTLLVEIRARVPGLAKGPPGRAKSENLKSETLKGLADGQCEPHLPAGILQELRYQRNQLDLLVRGQEELLTTAPPTGGEAASDGEAARIFALMKSLDDGDRKRKAPLGRVFRLLVLEGLTQGAVAVKCQCSPGLVSLRVADIEQRMKRPVAELRALASRLGEMDLTVKDSRARQIYRRGLTDDTGEET
jgi:hypothetical protein